jgi:hypothetical protein
MQFDQQKALEIIQKYKLKPSILALWKTRGTIPDRYLKDYEAPENRSKLSIIEEQIVLTKLSNKKLQLKAFFEKINIPISKYNDAKRTDKKQVPLQNTDIITINSELLRLKKAIGLDLSLFSGLTTYTEEQKAYLFNMLIEYPINILSLYECQASDKLYCKFVQRKKNPAVKMQDWEAHEIINKFYNLLKEL